MTSQQANAIRQAWIGSNPNLAYMSGAITADQYYQLTGQYAPGTAPAGGGGGYYGGGSPKKSTPYDDLKSDANKMLKAGASAAEVNDYLRDAYISYGATTADVKKIRTELPLSTSSGAKTTSTTQKSGSSTKVTTANGKTYYNVKGH